MFEEYQNGKPLPLEPGDRLSRPEFERRYDAMPKLRKAELIEGVVFMPSPTWYKRHGLPSANFGHWVDTYRFATPGVLGAENATVRLDLDNEPQPDRLLFIDPACGGQARISADDYIELAPELVGEISASTASIDLNLKFHVYRRNGVREYIVWRVLENAIDWFVLRDAQFERLAAGADGIFRSEVFPGLWLDSAALLERRFALQDSPQNRLC